MTWTHPVPPLRAVATGQRRLASRGSLGGRGDRRRAAVQQGDRARGGQTPELLVQEWSVLTEGAGTPLEHRRGEGLSCSRRSAVDSDDTDPPEALLARHNVHGRVAGVRRSFRDPAKSPDNWVHIGVSIGDPSVAVALARRDAGVALLWR